MPSSCYRPGCADNCRATVATTVLKPSSPFATGSFNVYVKSLGPWSGGLEYRYLGREPLSPDNQVQSGGYGEWNADVRFAFATNWSAGLGVYNILNRHANAAEFWYIDRLPGEPFIS